MEHPQLTRAARLYLRAWREAVAFHPHILLAIAIGVTFAPIALLLPLPMKIVVDSAIGGGPLPGPLAGWMPGVAGDEALLLAAGLAVGFAALQSAWGFLDRMFREWLSERMTLEFRSRLFLHGLGLPLASDDKGSFDAIQRIAQDAPALVWTALYGALPLITAGASLLGVFAVTASISVELGFLALATAVPAILLIHARQGRLREHWHVTRQAESDGLGIVHEVYGAQRAVTTFCQERREQRRFLEAGRGAMRARLDAIRAEGLLNIAFALCVAGGGAAVLYVAASNVRAGTMTTGDLLLVVGYAAQLFGPMRQIGDHIAGQQKALVSLERAFALLDRVHPIVDRPDARPLERVRGDMVLESVTYRYGGAGEARSGPVFRDVSFSVPAGSRVGLVGRTGSGKSTLLDLITRQLDPESGRITLDGVDLRDCRLADLRTQFAVVSQEPVLFSTSVAENIAYGRPGATLEGIVAAAKAAHAHDFIEALPRGYATRLGERGATLSGGERQRIALARAFLKDAPLLILDEPTSAVDVTTEVAIIEAVERLMQGRTTFMVAHRLSTLRMADLILRVENGRVVQETPPAPNGAIAA
jgi:ATP-binding cassette subfamily B protein